MLYLDEAIIRRHLIEPFPYVTGVSVDRYRQIGATLVWNEHALIDRLRGRLPGMMRVPDAPLRCELASFEAVSLTVH